MLAQQWSAIAERHQSGFIDIHAALVFARVPGDDADRFWDGLAASHCVVTSENDVTFSTVVKPLVEHIRGRTQLTGRPLPVHRVGGSEVQRSIFAAMVCG